MNLLNDERFHQKGLHNFEGNLIQPRHRWYPFKEGFSAELVEEAINSVGGKQKKLSVFDPFCGSGTTPVTAALFGHNATAIEVNPFCAFTSRVKCSPGKWRRDTYEYHLDRIERRSKRLKKPSPLEGFSTFTKSEGKSKWLFNNSVLQAHESVWRSIAEDSFAYNAPLKLAAIRAAMNCCNARKDGKALRYLKNWRDLDYDADDYRSEFRAIANQFINDTYLAPIHQKSQFKIHTGDSRIAVKSIAASSMDLMVTSPPYLNSFDYSDIYRPELFLGGFVDSSTELRNIRLQTLRSHIQVNWGGATNVDSALLSLPLNELRNTSGLWNKKIPDMVEAYFHDMQIVLSESSRVLKKGGQAWMVVSTSSYGGVEIPVDLILAELACASGFTLNGVYVLRPLRSAGQQQGRFATTSLPLRESLIILTRV